ncbi:MAG TPA: DUF1223 domain-containing protein, partial [Thermoanaerobaculia bacterium]|nr:DUF1223 domain-containing protein [Thermoanaerobaculia bacterium]
MKIFVPLAVLACAALFASPRGAAGGAGAPAEAPVLLELFTSQGCSSCPPADHLLTQLGQDPQLAGRVIPLSFHVDYWNYIGWRDPFSAAAWSDRQDRYSEAFHLGRVYTPQLVINGRSECVGSDEAQVRRRIAEAAKLPPAGRLALQLDPATATAPTLKVKVDASLTGAKPAHDLEVWVALYETNLNTAVGRGENARRTLHNDYVVRRLVRAFTLPATAPATGAAPRSGVVTLAVDPAWKR